MKIESKFKFLDPELQNDILRMAEIKGIYPTAKYYHEKTGSYLEANLRF